MFTTSGSNNHTEQFPNKHLGNIKKIVQLFRKLNFNRDVSSYLEANALDFHLLDELDIGVYIFDYFQNNYFYINNCFTRTTGISKGEMKVSGFSVLSRLIHDDDLSSVLDITRRAAEMLIRLSEPERTACCFKMYYRIRKMDGTVTWVLQMNKYINSHNSNSPIDLGYIICLPENQTTPRLAGFLTTSKRCTEISIQKPTSTQLSVLSRRELEVLRWVALGIKSSEIALKLNISVDTIKLHRRSILRKLNVSNSISAVRIFEEENMGNSVDSDSVAQRIDL
jgi:DNA-binding CsgD family transcriptional regulator